MTEPVTQLFAWLGVDALGDDGIVVSFVEGIGLTPLVSAKLANARRMEPAARLAEAARGKPVRLARFTYAGEIGPMTSPPDRPAGQDGGGSA